MKLDQHDKEINPYYFFKSPDGEDCAEKTYYYTKYSTVAGVFFSLYECVLISKPKTVRDALVRFGRFTLPCAGMGFAFGSSLCILAKLRGKSDPTNHFIAGAIAGSIWGAKYRSVSTGHTVALFLGLTAAYIKYFDHHKIPMFEGTYRTPEMRYNYPNMDFTIKTYDDPGRPDRA